jgi:hypothetical protein
VTLQGEGRISRRKDGKDFLYLPKKVVDDSAFPFKLESSVPIRVVIDPKVRSLLILPLVKTQGRRKKTH